jgi:hypothetical protein
VRALPHLKSNTRHKLEAICLSAASTDVQTKRKAAQEACRELVNATPLPAGTARDRALATCRDAGGTSGSGGK